MFHTPTTTTVSCAVRTNGLLEEESLMSKPTVTSVKAELDTHEAVCAERWKETILRIKRIEHIMIGTAGTTILLLVGIILNG